MKKLLALTLTLALILSLGAPALAEEIDLGVIGGPDGPTVVITPDETPADDCGEEMDTKAQYKAAIAAYDAEHPEELAGLDVEALIAALGYEDVTAEETFFLNHDYMGDTAEEAAKSYYVMKRQGLEYEREFAQSYRADYPEEWADFDVNAYYEAEFAGIYESKEQYMTANCLLTEEEFVDQLFVWHMTYDYLYDYGDDGYGYDENAPVTLTLWVNGEESQTEIAAENGVTYIDAAALRDILGPEAVAADLAGPVAIRPIAEAAGWDVLWYDGGWRGVDQEVQLWDRAKFEGQLKEEFAPLDDFLAQVLARTGKELFSEEAVAYHETVALDLTRFSTLDGDATYSLSCEVDCVMQNGLADVTVNFDASQLLKLVPEELLREMTASEGFTVAQLAAFLKAGTAEFLLDFQSGDMAYNIPLLALADASMAGWQYDTIDGLADMWAAWSEGEAYSVAGMFYETLLTAGEYSGAARSLAEYEKSVGMMANIAGKDCFSAQNGKTTFTLTTQQMNRMATAAMKDRYYGALSPEEDGGEPYSFFKYYDVTFSVDDRGRMTLNAHTRMDKDGISRALADMSADVDSYYTAATAMIYRVLLTVMDMDYTVSATSTPTSAEAQVGVHWNNVGKLDLRARTTAAAPAGKTPRTPEDVMQ